MRPRGSQLVLIVGDALVAVASVLSALHLRFIETPFAELAILLTKFTGATALAVMLPMVVFYLAELYSSSADYRRVRWLARILGATAVSFLVLVGLYYFLPMWRMYRGALAYHAASFVPSILVWRYLFSALRARTRPRRRALIVGAGKAATKLCELLESHPDSRWLVVGFANDGEPAPEPAAKERLLGDVRDLGNLVIAHNLQDVIYAGPTMSKSGVRNLLALKMRGLSVRDGPALYRELAHKLPVYQLDDIWLLSQDGFNLVRSPLTQRVQRLMDIVLAVIGLVLCAPLLVLAVLAIWLSMGRPIFFRQERVGRNEVVFWLYKLRTMKKDAEGATGPVWSKGKGDPRVTRVGRFLRRSRIDELPQLWNVLVGDMSFIGPRPERPHFVAQLKEEIPYYALRFLVKPGLSGWAQVNYRYGASVDDAVEKLQYELYYIQEMSLLLNLLILLKTAPAVLFHEGS